MQCEKETDRAFLMLHEGVSFWIQKRWLKARRSSSASHELTPAGWKAYHIAARAHWKHFGFDALKEFDLVKDTEKAVRLRCVVVRPDGTETPEEFWLPKSMMYEWGFVAAKIKEIEQKFPFVGTYVKWSGAVGRKDH
jgi:hypothetical protein